MGESAGASSILHHITSYGGSGNKKLPFQSAIIQSPGFFPQPDPAQDDATYQQFLSLAGAKTLDDLLTADNQTLMQINADMTYNSSYGIFKFGPTVDDSGWNSYVPDLPSKLLSSGRFNKGISLFLGHQKFDGLLFTPPWIRTDAQLATHVQKLFPNVSTTVLNDIKSMYPVASFATEKEKIFDVADFLDVSLLCSASH